LQIVGIIKSVEEGALRRRKWRREFWVTVGTARRYVTSAFLTQTIMPPVKNKTRKRGRPPSGNKTYNIRMPPAAHAALLKVAWEDGFDHLGDWLAQLPGMAVGAEDYVEPARRLGARLARKRFIIMAGKAKRLVDELYDLVDFDTTVGCDEAVAVAHTKLLEAVGKVSRFMKLVTPKTAKPKAANPKKM